MTGTFVSFLKKFGQIVLKAAEGVIGEPKVILQQVEADSTDLRTVIGFIKTAEGMWAAAGAQQAGSQKLAAVTPFVATMIGDIEVVVGTKISSIIKDQPGFNAGVQQVITGLVAVLNACGD